ncbi:hypothetical protein ASD54_15535 [Rhizobium sp. Root149]|uniref:LysR substrate-binding domain-containing protein n=1 Tax=Rhizobium sp. Root149 TaxID=1736473 RepID=UPI000715BC44|nr:LysR substrate-binding domain-containing protein [Rhizobium sp. Root149]KQZ49345.1 hypothetical protein ASD54_15535 [Rhizobium sp. Root149]
MTINRKLPLVALRAFESAARCGRHGDAAEELSVTSGAISKHIAQLETFLGIRLFEGNRNRPRLTAEGQAFATSLSDAFEQIDAAVAAISRRDTGVLDVACIGTLAMRWLIPRLSNFSQLYPNYDVCLSTDGQRINRSVDVEILILPPDEAMGSECLPLFNELVGLVFASNLQERNISNEQKALSLPRLGTQTRPHAWTEWGRLTGRDLGPTRTTSRMFDHYHLTIEACLNGLGSMIAPLHLIGEEVRSGKLIAPWGFVESGYSYAVRSERPNHRKNSAFIQWLQDETANMRTPIQENFAALQN